MEWEPGQRTEDLQRLGGGTRDVWLEDELLVLRLLALVRLSVENAVSTGVGGNAAIRISLDGFQGVDNGFRFPSI
jgi:hypothetical protein